MVDREKVLKAADQLESLIPIMKDMVIRFRDGSDKDPYVSLYWLRRYIGYEVSRLGCGSPTAAQQTASMIEYGAIYE